LDVVAPQMPLTLQFPAATEPVCLSVQRLAAYGEPVEGTPFGRYRLIELLGRGGMGEVWRAHDTSTNRTVAIKLLPPHLAQDDTFVKRFRREAEAAARLNSPHIIPIHTYGEIDGRLYVDMRLIEGRDLQQVLAGGPLEPARAVRIIEGVAKALHAAHKVGLLHRDVKPSNILLDENDFAYLIDFGIARAADETRLTKSGYAIGTFQYIAPERFGTRAEEDARADIYSLACVLYECLTGRPPFAGTTMAGLVAAHLNTPPPRPSATQPNVPAQFDPVISTGMAKDPDNRYATTIEFADAAQATIATPVAPAREPSPLGDARRRAPEPARRDDQVPPPRAPAPKPVRQLPVKPTQPATQPAARQRPPGRPPVPQLQSDAPPPKSAGTTLLAWGLKWPLISAIVAILAAVGILGYLVLSSPPASPQIALPFTGLNNPTGAAVDSAGNLYVTDNGHNRVLRLAAGSTTQSVLPFTGLNGPGSVAVDSAGNVYATDIQSNRVLRLAAGSTTQSVLPFTGLNGPGSVAVDSAGNVYATDIQSNRVLRLAAGSTTQSVLPFADLSYPDSVAVDSAGNLYVTDSGHNRVLRLAADSTTQSVLPFAGLNNPTCVAVDSAGNLYVNDSDNNRVLKLPAG
jgi:serine/threonine protein kinase, bacterial